MEELRATDSAVQWEAKYARKRSNRHKAEDSQRLVFTARDKKSFLEAFSGVRRSRHLDPPGPFWDSCLHQFLDVADIEVLDPTRPASPNADFMVLLDERQDASGDDRFVRSWENADGRGYLTQPPVGTVSNSRLMSLQELVQILSEDVGHLGSSFESIVQG